MARQLRWDSVIDSTDRSIPSGILQPLPYTPLLLPIDLNALEDATSEFYCSIEACLTIAPKDAGDWHQLMFALSLVNTGLDEASLEGTWMKRIRRQIVTTSGLDMWAAARRSI